MSLFHSVKEKDVAPFLHFEAGTCHIEGSEKAAQILSGKAVESIYETKRFAIYREQCEGHGWFACFKNLINKIKYLFTRLGTNSLPELKEARDNYYTLKGQVADLTLAIKPLTEAFFKLNPVRVGTSFTEEEGLLTQDMSDVYNANFDDEEGLVRAFNKALENYSAALFPLISKMKNKQHQKVLIDTAIAYLFAHIQLSDPKKAQDVRRKILLAQAIYSRTLAQVECAYLQAPLSKLSPEEGEIGLATTLRGQEEGEAERLEAEHLAGTWLDRHEQEAVRALAADKTNLKALGREIAGLEEELSGAQRHLFSIDEQIAAQRDVIARAKKRRLEAAHSKSQAYIALVHNELGLSKDAVAQEIVSREGTDAYLATDAEGFADEEKTNANLTGFFGNFTRALQNALRIKGPFHFRGGSELEQAYATATRQWKEAVRLLKEAEERLQTLTEQRAPLAQASLEIEALLEQKRRALKEGRELYRQQTSRLDKMKAQTSHRTHRAASPGSDSDNVSYYSELSSRTPTPTATPRPYASHSLHSFEPSRQVWDAALVAPATAAKAAHVQRRSSQSSAASSLVRSDSGLSRRYYAPTSDDAFGVYGNRSPSLLSEAAPLAPRRPLFRSYSEALVSTAAAPTLARALTPRPFASSQAPFAPFGASIGGEEVVRDFDANAIALDLVPFRTTSRSGAATPETVRGVSRASSVRTVVPARPIAHNAVRSAARSPVVAPTLHQIHQL